MTDDARPIGQLALALANDVRQLAGEAAKYRIAYERLTQAIDELKARPGYEALEADLVALLKVPERTLRADRGPQPVPPDAA